MAPKFCQVFTKLSFIFGIVCLACSVIPFLGFLAICCLAEVGIVFGIVALIVGVGKFKDASLKSRCILGIVFCAVSLVLGSVLQGVYLAVLGQLGGIAPAASALSLLL